MSAIPFFLGAGGCILAAIGVARLYLWRSR